MESRRSRLSGWWLVVCCLAVLSADSSRGDIIPQTRRTDWSKAGVAGGIPNVTKIYTNFSPGVSLSQLNSALRSCPSNQVVKLAPGNYSFGGYINYGQKEGVVLRGSGPGSTFITFTPHGAQQNIMIGEQTIDRTVPPSGQIRNWTGGFSQGSTNITLDNMTGVPPVGHLLVLDQLNDNVWVKARVQEGCDYCGRAGGERAQAQYVRIVAKNGNTVTIEPGLHMMNWSAALSPQAFYWTEKDTVMCGLEDLTITNQPSSGLYAIQISQAQNCWVKNVDMYAAPQAAIATTQCKNIEVRRFSMLSNQGAGNLSYGVIFYMASDSLMVDCIGANVTAGVVLSPQAEGNVVAYNFFTNAVYSPNNWDIASISAHDAHVCMNLVEGNWANKMYIDSIHGSASHNTLFRNYFHGHQVNRDNNTMAFNAEQYCLSNNLVGNIFGTPGYHNFYKVTNGTQFSGSGNTAIYILGNYDSAGGVPWDNRVAPSTLIHGNYDTVNAAQIWDSAISDRVLPNSYFVNSKPSFFGNLNWPPFDPTAPNAHNPTNLPAGYRFVFRTDPPSGPVNQPPIASANANVRSGPAPLSVSFSSTGSSDPEGASLTYQWTFGDGGASTAANPSHTYQSDGAYTARLAVSDGVNTTTSSDILITVGNQPPTAAAAATPNTGAAPLNVAFSSAGSTDPEGSALTYQWDFGDGTSASTANPNHNYANPGIYAVRLTVSDGAKSASSDLTVSVYDPASSLVAAYNFDEGSGTSITDRSANGNAGSVNGATWTTAGKNGGALVFNGSSAYVRIPPSASLNLPGLTLEAWVYPTALGGWRDIIYRANDGYYLEASSPQGPGPVTGGTYSGTPLAAPSALPLNTWSHLAATYDGATMRLFLNGTQVATRAQTGAIQTSDVDALSIGGDPVSGTYFSGRIDDVRIYNRALSPAEIQDDIATPVGGQKPSAPSNIRLIGGQ